MAEPDRHSSVCEANVAPDWRDCAVCVSGGHCWYVAFQSP